MAHQSESVGASQQPSKVGEAVPSTTISRGKTVTKRGRQVKAQFRALFHKKDSSPEVAHQQDQTKDVTQTTTTSLIVGGKNKEAVVGVEPISSKATSDKDLKTNIIVTTTTTATVTSSLDSSKATPTIPTKPPRPSSASTSQPQKPPTKSNPSQHPHTSTNDNEITSLRAALQTALARSQILESRLAKADLQTHKLTRKSEILTNSLCRANTDFESTRQKLQDTIDSLRAEISRLGDVEMLLMKEESRVRALKLSIEKRDREVEDLNGRLGRMDGKVRVLRGEASRLRGERDRVRRENERLWAIVGVNRLNLRPDRDRAGEAEGGEGEGEESGGDYFGETSLNQGRDRGDVKDKKEKERREEVLLGKSKLKKGGPGEDEMCNLSGMTEVERSELRRERVRRWIGDRMPVDAREEVEK